MLQDFRDNLEAEGVRTTDRWATKSRILTIPSSCTLDNGISASMSITFDMDAGMASYVGAAGVAAAGAAGRDAARAAAMDVAAIIASLV